MRSGYERSLSAGHQRLGTETLAGRGEPLGRPEPLPIVDHADRHIESHRGKCPIQHGIISMLRQGGGELRGTAQSLHIPQRRLIGNGFEVAVTR